MKASMDTEDIIVSDFNHSHLESVLRHIKLVQEATQLLGKRLIESGESEDGRKLIARGLRHDASKLHGVEWDFLIRPKSDEMTKEEKDEYEKLLGIAWRQHVETNDHHPECWGEDGINKMSDICIAEMVCDWYARSQEMATDLRGWIKEEATKKYGMSLRGKTYKRIKYYVDMLIDPAFKPMKKNGTQVTQGANGG